MNIFQIIFVPGCLLAAFLSLWRARQGKTDWLAAVFWGAIWTAAAIAIAAPEIPSLFAAFLGISRGADLVMYLGLLAGILVTRYFYNRSRRLENLVTQLVREQAIATAQMSALRHRT